MDGIKIILLSALPLTELRASIPAALLYYELSVWQAVLFSVIGNAIPVAIMFLFFPPLLRFAEKHLPWLHRVLNNHIRKLEQKYSERYHRYGALFLFLFVAVPLPGSGVWTGSLLAIIFGMKPRYSVPAILLGMLLAALIVVFLIVYASSV